MRARIAHCYRTRMHRPSRALRIKKLRVFEHTKFSIVRYMAAVRGTYVADRVRLYACTKLVLFLKFEA